MRKILLAAMIATAPTMAHAAGVGGVWKTESNEDGAYLEVTMAPCSSDAAKTCGTITSAITKDGADPNYGNLGKLIVKDMESDDGINFSGGTIWDPEKDKTYSSKMTLKGDDLDVEGCVAFFCQGQDWKRVK